MVRYTSGMLSSRFLRTTFICIVIALFAVACSSNDSKNKDVKKRTRREDTTTTKKPSSSLTTTAPSANTTPIVEQSFLRTEQIAVTWTEKNLCNFIPAAKAQSILKMSTAPAPKYSYSESSGARCAYASGNGDEIYIEYSTTSYADARMIDTSLNAEGEEIVVEGVGGVSKANKATGTTYELNVNGAKSNEWIINAPEESQTKDLAKILIAALKDER